MTRERLLSQLSAHILDMQRRHPTRVAIDGIDACGKTWLADELASIIERRGRPVIRASLDGFHRPRAERYYRGPDSPEGYYLDSFDYGALKEALLLPLGPEGDLNYRTAVFDFRSDAPVDSPLLQAPANAVLLLDGVFLLRPELNAHWDYRIFVQVDFEVALRRAVQRDRELFGSPEAVRARYEERYFPAQRSYLERVQPQGLADAIVHNNDPAHITMTIRNH